MIRILHTIDTIGSGGAETVFINLVRNLDRTKFEPIVAISGEGWVSEQLKVYGIKPEFVNCHGSFSLSYLKQLVRIILEKKIDIIQSHLFGSNLYCSLAGIICRRPVVSTFHGFVDIKSKDNFASVKTAIINHAPGIIVFVSDRLKDFYVQKKGFSSAKSLTIYNGIDTTLFRPARDDAVRRRLGLRAGDVLVGAVGNIRPSKGYEVLLQAAKLVVDRHPEFHFVLAGAGPGEILEQLKGMRAELGLQERLYFWGFESNVPHFMNNLDLFVLPSISEGFSISTVEAMASGVPVIATRSGGPEEIVTHLKTGILLDPGIPSQLEESILELWRNTGLRKTLSVAAREHAQREFSKEKATKKYELCYGRLLGDKVTCGINN